MPRPLRALVAAVLPLVVSTCLLLIKARQVGASANYAAQADVFV